MADQSEDVEECDTDTFVGGSIAYWQTSEPTTSSEEEKRILIPETTSVGGATTLRSGCPLRLTTLDMDFDWTIDARIFYERKLVD